jgi:hypothetical protein
MSAETVDAAAELDELLERRGVRMFKDAGCGWAVSAFWTRESIQRDTAAQDDLQES